MLKSPIAAAILCAASLAGAAQAQNLFVLPGSNSTNSNVIVLSNLFSQVATFQAGPGSFQVLAKPDGSKFYVISNSGSQTVTVVDPTFQTPRAIASLGTQATAAAMTPNGQRLLVVAGSLHIFDTSTDQDLTPNGLLTTAPLVDLTISLDGTRAFVLGKQSQVNPQGIVYAIDLTTNGFGTVGTLPLDSTVNSISTGPNGLIYVSGVNRFWEINPSTVTLTPAGEIPLIASAGRPAFTPDAKYALLPNQTPGNTGAALDLIDLTAHAVAGTSANLGNSIIDKIVVPNGNVAYAYASDTQSLYQFALPSLAVSGTNFQGVNNLAINTIALSPDIPGGAHASTQNLYIISGGNLYKVDLPSSQVVGSLPVTTPQASSVVFAGPAVTNVSAVTLLQYNDKQAIAAGGTPLPLTVRVLDGNGNPISGAPVTFATVTNGVTFSNPSAITGANGYASTTFSGGSGQIIVTATSGTATVNFTLVVGSTGGGGTGGPTGGLSIVAGQGQVFNAGFGSAAGNGSPIIVALTDVNGNPIANVPVTFEPVTSAGGSGSGVTLSFGPIGTDGGPAPDSVGHIVYTDTNGQASVNVQTSTIPLGIAFSQSSIQVSAPNANSITFYESAVPLTGGLTARLSPAAPYTMPPTPSGSTLKGAFTLAVAPSLAGGVLPNVGVQIVNPISSNATAPVPSPYFSCADPTGMGVLTDMTGQATCDLVVKAPPGTYQFSVLYGYYGSNGPYTITVTPGLPGSLKILQGDKQTGAPGQQLPQAFRVQVTDAQGNPLSGIGVSFTIVTPGSISLSNVSSATDQNGYASALGTLGNIPGTFQVKVTPATGTGSATFTYTVMSPATGIQPVSGGGQTTLVNTPFASPLVVRVVDATGKPVSGVMVTFSATGNATVGNPTATTDSSGQAQTTVIAGLNAGNITVTASAAGGFSTSFALTARLPGPQNVTLLNGASFQPGISPGSLAVIKGTGLLPGVQGVVVPTSIVGPLPTQLSGFSVTFNGVPAPIYNLSNQNGQEQVTVQVPYEVQPGTATVTINAVGGGVATITTPVQPVAPGFFQTLYNNQTYGVAIRQSDGSYINPSNPAHANDVVCFFLTGLGQTSPLMGTNQVGIANQNIVEPIDVGLNNSGVRLVSATTLPGQVAVYLVCLQVPMDVVPNPMAPVGLIVHDPTGDIYAQGTYIPIQ